MSQQATPPCGQAGLHGVGAPSVTRHPGGHWAVSFRALGNTAARNARARQELVRTLAVPVAPGSSCPRDTARGVTAEPRGSCRCICLSGTAGRPGRPFPVHVPTGRRERASPCPQQHRGRHHFCVSHSDRCVVKSHSLTANDTGHLCLFSGETSSRSLTISNLVLFLLNFEFPVYVRC